MSSVSVAAESSTVPCCVGRVGERPSPQSQAPAQGWECALKIKRCIDCLELSGVFILSSLPPARACRASATFGDTQLQSDPSAAARLKGLTARHGDADQQRREKRAMVTRECGRKATRQESQCRGCSVPPTLDRTRGTRAWSLLFTETLFLSRCRCAPHPQFPLLGAPFPFGISYRM